MFPLGPIKPVPDYSVVQNSGQSGKSCRWSVLNGLKPCAANPPPRAPRVAQANPAGQRTSAIAALAKKRSVTPLRPSNVTLGIQGNANVVAHPGKPSACRHTHRKFVTLNPRAIEAELISNPDGDFLVRSRELINKAKSANTGVPPKAPPSKAGLPLKWLGQKAAAAVGIRHNKPVPHAQMRRFMGTAPNLTGNAKDQTSKHGGEANTPITNAQLHALTVGRLECGDRRLKAEIDQQRIIEIESAFSRNEQHAHDSLSLRERRAANLSNGIAELTQRRAAISQRLAQCTALARNAAAALADLKKQVNSTQTALADARRKHYESVPLATLNNHLFAISLSIKDICDHEDAHGKGKQYLGGLITRPRSKRYRQLLGLMKAWPDDISRLPQGAPVVLLKNLDQACGKYLKGNGRSRTKIKELQKQVSHGLEAARQLPPRLDPMPSITDDLARRVDEQAANLAQCQRFQTVQREIIERFVKEVDRLERELGKVDQQLKQAAHSAMVNADVLHRADDEMRALKTPPSEFDDIITGRAQTLSEAEGAEKAARESLDTAMQARIQHLLNALPGFDAGTRSTQGAEILRAWIACLAERAKVFDAEAISVADGTAIGLQALSIAADKNAAVAAEALSTLSAVSLRELVPRPGTSLAGPLLDLSPQSAAARARLLANVPRGMQVLSHMLRRDDDPLSKEQLEAVQIYLRAGQHIDSVAADDVDTRQWLTAAQVGAQYAVHGASVVEGLAKATLEQRSAFHAFRNGYESKAAGSPYAQANAHLQMFTRWVRQGATGRASRMTGGLNPLHSLKEGMRVAGAEALPTPQRRAGEELGNAAGHLAGYLTARRHAQLAGGFGPPSVELAMQAVAQYVQGLPVEKDLTRLRLDARAISAIKARHVALESYARNRAGDRGRPEAPAHPGFDQIWKMLCTGRLTLLKTMDSLQRAMLAHTPISGRPQGVGTFVTDMQATERVRFHRAVGTAKRLLYDGDSEKVRSPQALFDFLRDFLEKLEWRDKMRITAQKVTGLNLLPLSVSLAVIQTGLGLKLILAGQKNDDCMFEIHMGRTGLYMQIGRQTTRQTQIGVGAGGGCLVPGIEKVFLGVGISANWRMRKESSIENGLQIRVPRRGKGQELEQRAQFLSMFEYLMRLAADTSAGPLEKRDLLGALLANHPGITVGLIADAPREIRSKETNVAVTVGTRVGNVDGEPRRVFLGASIGLKTKCDKAAASTPVAGYMTMQMKDSIVQTRVEGSARVSAGVMLKKFDRYTDRYGAQAGQTREMFARLYAGVFDAKYARELYSKGIMTFSTLWLFNNEIDPARTDCGFEFQTFDAFERNVRQNWDLWVHYGISKLKGEIDEKLEYMIAERMLEDFMEQVREHMRDNKFATVIVDWSMKPEVAPHMDALRAQAKLLKLAGRDEEAAETNRAFDDLMAQPALWEPSMLLLREKGKRQRERGIDFFVKRQSNRLAESMRTVGQWLPYDPVPRDPAPGRSQIEIADGRDPDRGAGPAGIRPIADAAQFEQIKAQGALVIDFHHSRSWRQTLFGRPVMDAGGWRLLPSQLAKHLQAACNARDEVPAKPVVLKNMPADPELYRIIDQLLCGRPVHFQSIELRRPMRGLFYGHRTPFYRFDG